MEQVRQRGTEASPTVAQVASPQTDARPPTAENPPPLQPDEQTLKRWTTLIRVFAILLVSMSIINFALQSSNRERKDDVCQNIDSCPVGITYHGVDVLSLPILSFAFVWNAAGLFRYCINKSAVHPGVRMGFDLVAFGAMLSGGIVSTLRTKLSRSAVYGGTRGGGDLASAMELAASVLQFILFILACISIDRRNTYNKQRMDYLHNLGKNPQVTRPGGVYPAPPPGMMYIVAPKPKPSDAPTPPSELDGRFPKSTPPIELVA